MKVFLEVETLSNSVVAALELPTIYGMGEAEEAVYRYA